MKLPFHSEIAEEEEHSFFFCKFCKLNIRVGKDFLMKLSFHSEYVEEEEYLFLL